jgi:hypothetical protein
MLALISLNASVNEAAAKIVRFPPTRGAGAATGVPAPARAVVERVAVVAPVAAVVVRVVAAIAAPTVATVAVRVTTAAPVVAVAATPPHPASKVRISSRLQLAEAGRWRIRLSSGARNRRGRSGRIADPLACSG